MHVYIYLLVAYKVIPNNHCYNVKSTYISSLIIIMLNVHVVSPTSYVDRRVYSLSHDLNKLRPLAVRRSVLKVYRWPE